MVQSTAVDAIVIEIVSQSMAGVVQEMQNSLFCTGYSTIIRESRDASCAILDAQGRVVAQHTVLPLHLGAFPACMDHLLERYPVEEMRDGDSFIVNHPYYGGNPHATDVAVVAPILVDGRLFGFSGSIAHKSDIGGLVPGTNSGQAREIFHEGLLLPPVRFYIDHEPVPRDRGDPPGQQPHAGAGDGGPARPGGLQPAGGRPGARAVRQVRHRRRSPRRSDRLIDQTESRVRAAVATWPDGSYAGERVLHNEGYEDGRPVHVKVTARRSRATGSASTSARPTTR